MNIEKYTERSRGFIQSAQSLALREGHQQFTPEHVLKVLLDDPEGLAAGLIDRSGGNSRQALAGAEEALGKMPKVSGSGSGQVYLAASTARLFDSAEKIADKAGDSFVTVERLLLAIAPGEGQRRRQNSRQGGGHAAEPQLRDRAVAQGPRRQLAVGRERL
jgi:ATP-dependent Clp protease ATP-binding subunit ClpB